MAKKRRPQRRDWKREIDKLNESASGKRRIRMGSAGSAQVTRVRLLEEYNGLTVWTEGPDLILSVVG